MISKSYSYRSELLHPTRPFPTEVSVAVDEPYCGRASIPPINHTDSRGIQKDAEDRRGGCIKCSTEQDFDRSDMRNEGNCLVRM